MFTRVKTKEQLEDVLMTLVAICDRVEPFPNFVVTCLLYSIRFYVPRDKFHRIFFEMVSFGYNPIHPSVTDVEKTMYQHIKHIVLNYERKNNNS